MKQDLATYRIIGLDPSLQVVEAAVGKGDICGSVMVNHRFVEFVEKKTGPVPADSMQDVRCHLILLRAANNERL